MVRHGSLLFILFALLAAPGFASQPSKQHGGLTGPELRLAVNILLVSCLEDTAAGNLEQGEKSCSEAIALDASSVMAYKLRGYGYLMAHRFERGEADFRTAIRLVPNDAELLAGLGQSLSGQGRFWEATAQFGKAVQIAPTNAAYHNGLCWARAGTGKALQTALGDCNRALMLAPGTPGPLNSRGLVHLRLGQAQAAIVDYDASLKIQPVQASASFGRGLANLALGRLLQGVADIWDARRADPDIDALYATLGILSPECARDQTGGKCPKGFPPRRQSKPSDGPWISVSLDGIADQDYILTIEAGRLEAMMAQIEALLQRSSLSRPRNLSKTHSQMLDSVAQTVSRFHEILPQLCAEIKISELDCRGYRVTLPQSDDPAHFIKAAFGRIAPAWSSLCRAHNAHCIME